MYIYAFGTHVYLSVHISVYVDIIIHVLIPPPLFHLHDRSVASRDG